MATKSTSSTKATVKSAAKLGVGTLMIMNIVAVVSLRGLPAEAVYGMSSAFYYLFAALVFLQAVYASKNAGKNQVTFYSEIENGVIQETKEHKEQYCFEEIEERELLEEYAKCMKFLTKESYRAGVDKMQKELISFFDADCVATISWENETYLGIEEVHKDSASVMAKIL